jgi:hypothetical protein
VGWIYIYIYIYIYILIIVGLGYSKIKNLKNGPSSVLLSLGDLKNLLGLDLKNPKKGDYEVGMGVKVRD